MASTAVETGTGDSLALATWATEIRSDAGDGSYWPAIVLFDADESIHTIVEVDASDSQGELYSRRARCYRAIPSVQNYVVARANKPQITWFTRLGEGRWLFGAADDIRASARLEAPPVMLTLAEIYDGLFTVDPA
jgi:hypothetical protein